ncbi:hypothetical protein PALU110988_02250 [Paenibacillus lupini]|uniref:hypothetical protein n=1 Tax=Paenibacillus lupini TaxID=1450204 RepID=UPI001423E28E|nr:hypothetical protein [Paenibacillus lupini]NIK20921.1 hypothetical protein [Paenibacillus lupini]
MEQEHQSKKRSYALPITLLLLVFSLTGNVFLYSQSLQGEQNDKYDKGIAIIGSATKASAYYQAVLDNAGALLDGKDTEAGTVIRNASGLVEFLQQSHSFDESKFDSDQVYDYIIDVNNSLQYINEQDGTLTEAEASYLKSLKDVYASQLAVLDQFQFEAAKSRSGSIQIGAGIGWLDIPKQLEQSISGHSSMKYPAQ